MSYSFDYSFTHASDPSADRDALGYLCDMFPEAVLSNPVLPLYLLEDPSWDVPRRAARLLAIRHYREAYPDLTLPQWADNAWEGTGSAMWGVGTSEGAGSNQFPAGSGRSGGGYSLYDQDAVDRSGRPAGHGWGARPGANRDYAGE